LTVLSRVEKFRLGTIQHQQARRVLEIIRAANAEHRLLTYQSVAAELGRDPSTHARAIAQVCDLLDAAAAHANVPLLALVAVRNAAGHINPMAWKKNCPPGLRKDIIDRSLAHRFTSDDFAAITSALTDLAGLSNRAAWKTVFGLAPQDAVYRALSVAQPDRFDDALDDLGSDAAMREAVTGQRYKRDPQVRQAVEHRARGRCEYCDQMGFSRPDGSAYVETHHIIALAEDGADRVYNVIALCANHHREAHFGASRGKLEQEFIEAVRRRVG
jgi:HNH endonuclease